VGAYDADILEKEFAPEFIAQDIVNLGFTQIYLRLMINGVGSRPFSASTLPPIAKLEHSFKDKIIEASRNTYSIPRNKVEELIKKWHADGAPVVLNKSSSIITKKDDKFFVKKSVLAPAPSTKQEIKKEEVAAQESPQMFSAECSVCGKKTYVPFQPDEKRAIYCKDHKNNFSQTKPESKKPDKKKDAGNPIATVSLNSLKEKSAKDTFKNDKIKTGGENKYSNKTSANLSALREALNEITTSDKPSEKRKGGVLKPGQKVKFD